MKELKFFTALLALGVSLGLAASAQADTVGYNTSGTFSTTAGPTLPGTNGSSLTFVGMPTTTFVVTPVTLQLGYFLPSYPAFPTVGTITSSGTFTLTINQTAPTSGTELDSPDTLSGSISGYTFSGVPIGSDSIVLTFNQTTFTLGNEEYELQNLTGNSMTISSAGPSSVNSYLTAVSMGQQTPEPGFYGLMAVGIGALLTVVTRRKRREV